MPVKKEITIWSEGTRVAADLHLPDDVAEGEKCPAILLCHGWGGAKEHLSRTYAVNFSKAGFVCLTFDYRGWFDSDARLITMDKQPAVDADGFMTVRAKPVREIIDVLAQNEDIHNALAYLVDHPSVDASRIGLWGSSLGGGHVMHVAGTNNLIKVVVAQVPGMGEPLDEHGFYAVPPEIQQVAGALARGEIDLPPRPADQPEALKGIADFRKWRYFPRDAARHIRIPTLIIDQKEEEYGGRESSGLAAKAAIPSTTTVDYHVFEGSHYEIYRTNYEAGARLAREWFLKYL